MVQVSDAVRKMGMDMELILPNTDYTSVAKLMKGEVKIGTVRVGYSKLPNKLKLFLILLLLKLLKHINCYIVGSDLEFYVMKCRQRLSLWDQVRLRPHGLMVIKGK